MQGPESLHLQLFSLLFADQDNSHDMEMEHSEHVLHNLHVATSCCLNWRIAIKIATAIHVPLYNTVSIGNHMVCRQVVLP